jgi:hypothetical protein
VTARESLELGRVRELAKGILARAKSQGIDGTAPSVQKPAGDAEGGDQLLKGPLQSAVCDLVLICGACVRLWKRGEIEQFGFSECAYQRAIFSRMDARLSQTRLRRGRKAAGRAVSTACMARVECGPSTPTVDRWLLAGLNGPITEKTGQMEELSDKLHQVSVDRPG